MIKNFLMGVLLLSSLVAMQAQACTSISVENVNGSFVTSKEEGMIPFKVSIICNNPDNTNMRARLIHSSATGNSSGVTLYKDGITTENSGKILEAKILDNTFREFNFQEISFISGTSTNEFNLYLSIPEFKLNEPGNYSGLINFDVEY